MQNSSAFQYLAIDTIGESTTNPRRTFEENKLQELAEHPAPRPHSARYRLPKRGWLRVDCRGRDVTCCEAV